MKPKHGDMVYVRCVYQHPVEYERDGHNVAPVRQDGTFISADRMLDGKESICVNRDTIVTRSDIESFAVYLAHAGQGEADRGDPVQPVPGAVAPQAAGRARDRAAPDRVDQHRTTGRQPQKPW